MHDVAEVYTGDTPAPVKRDSEQLWEALHLSAAKWEEMYDIPMPELKEEDLILLKVADMLDAMLSAIEERIMGNRYAQKVIDNAGNYLNEMGLSEELMQKIQQMVVEVDTSWVPTSNKKAETTTA